MHNLGAQQTTKEDFAISRGEAGCPLKMHNFQGEATQHAIGPSPGEQLVKGIDQVVTDMLPLCKKHTEACELDIERQIYVMVEREAQT